MTKKEKKKKLKVFHVQGWNRYSNWIEDVQAVSSVEEADVVFFLGGEDVSPHFYGAKKHPSTYSNKTRDEYEREIYQEAEKLGKKILGVCRGAQLICALQPKGMLIQHQPDPELFHTMKTFDEKEIEVSSMHHQAMYPFNMDKEDYKVLGWTEKMLRFHQGGEKEELDPPMECEVVYFPKGNALGIQSHPEMMDKDCESNVWMREILDKFIKDEL